MFGREVKMQKHEIDQSTNNNMKDRAGDGSKRVSNMSSEDLEKFNQVFGDDIIKCFNKRVIDLGIQPDSEQAYVMMMEFIKGAQVAYEDEDVTVIENTEEKSTSNLTYLKAGAAVLGVAIGGTMLYNHVSQRESGNSGLSMAASRMQGIRRR